MLRDFDEKTAPPASASPTPAKSRRGLGGLRRSAALGWLHRRGSQGLGPAVRAPGRSARQPRRFTLPSRDRLAEAVASRACPSWPSSTLSSSRAPAGAPSRCPGWCPMRSSSQCLANASSRSAISSAPATSSIIWRHPTASTICSAISRCWRTTISPPWPSMSAVSALRQSLPAKGSVPRGSIGTASNSRSRREQSELKILGAGLASSFGKSHFSLESGAVERLPFSVGRAVNTPYRHDAFQPRYLVSASLDRTHGRSPGADARAAAGAVGRARYSPRHGGPADQGRISKRARPADAARRARLLCDRRDRRHLRRRRRQSGGPDGQQLHLGVARSAAAAGVPRQAGARARRRWPRRRISRSMSCRPASSPASIRFSTRAEDRFGARPGRAARRARRSSRIRSACSNASASPSTTAATTTSSSARSSRRASMPALDPLLFFRGSYRRLHFD